MVWTVVSALAIASSFGTPSSPAQVGGTAGVLTRLGVIAQDLGQGTGDPTAELTEALKLIGFAIWKDDVKSFAPQTSNSPLHLAITDGEIRDYGQMCRMNQGATLGNLEASFDDLVKKLGAPVSVTNSVNAFLADNAHSSKEPVFYLQTFLRDLNASHRRSPSSSFTADSQLDAVQSLLLMRVISEDIFTPVRKRLKAQARAELALASNDEMFCSSGMVLARDPSLDLIDMPFAGTNHPAATDAVDRLTLSTIENPVAQAGQQLPGWAEDLYVGTINQIYSAVDQWEGQNGSTGNQIMQGVTVFNGAMTLIKFISAYVKLEGTVDLSPGPPLVRTTDTLEQGAKATLKATFKINGDPTSDTMQSLRRTLALIGGIDLGQPTEAPLKGVETEWTIGQSTKYATKQTIETERGKSVDLSKVKTDDQGVASVFIAGKPQFIEIDKNTAQKITKHIAITVSPQLAANDVMADTINIALGIKSGPPGFIQIVTGFVQHMKWGGKINYDLNVTDWVPGDVYGTLTMDVEATFTNKEMVDAANQDTVSHHLSIENARMKVLSGAATQIQIPNIDPSILKNLTAEQQAQVAAAMAKITAASSATTNTGVLRYVVAGDVGSYKMSVQDNNYIIQQAQKTGEATHGMRSTYGSADGKAEGDFSDSTTTPGAIPAADAAIPPSFTIEIHPADGYMLLSVNASCPATVRNSHSDEDQPSQNFSKTDTARIDMMNGLTLEPSVQNNGGIKIPYKRSTNNPDASIGGSVTLPCTFHGQSCNVTISFSMLGKKKS
jgi:hypothetical protein